ncbi:hypothetical protein C518_3012 [Lysinibacillus fusiformis ZB2]|nr:hypothetical protein C518_3012 [Lysinibacillus fusiformis ZB2]
MDLAEFLRNEAEKKGYQKGDFLENITFRIDEELNETDTGVVYGFVVELDDEEVINLFEEAKKIGGNKQKELIKVNPIIENYYPLYWGKSLDSLGRINAHLKGHGGGNSNLRLKEYGALKNKNIIYARVYIKRNLDFEKYLAKTYPPLLKTRKV